MPFECITTILQALERIIKEASFKSMSHETPVPRDGRVGNRTQVPPTRTVYITTILHALTYEPTKTFSMHIHTLRYLGEEQVHSPVKDEQERLKDHTNEKEYVFL